MRTYAMIFVGAALAAGCGGAGDGETGSVQQGFELGTWIAASYHGLDVGGSHGCVIDNCGGIQCFGRNDYGQTTVPSYLRHNRWKEVSAGTLHTCGLTTKGSIHCWGNDYFGQATPPVGTGYQHIDAGPSHTCAIDSGGNPRCWGNITTPPPASVVNATGIASGHGYACAEYDDPSLRTKILGCWSGGSVAPSPSHFFSLLGSTPPHGTSAGRYHACTLRGSQLLCWGSNTYGESDGKGLRGGNDPFAVLVEEDPAGTRIFPAYAPGMYGWTAVATGYYHTCGLNSGYANHISSPSNAFCWGSDSFGESSGIPSQQFTELSAGAYVSCGITSANDVLCWGRTVDLPAQPALPTQCLSYTLPSKPTF